MAVCPDNQTLEPTHIRTDVHGFFDFDVLRYETLPVQDGYSEWADTYENTVLDEMDVRLLEKVKSVPWSELASAIDLACGTGRTGTWLRGKGVGTIDGIDITAAIQSAAEEKGIYRNLVLGNITDTGLIAEHYDLSIEVLADEHLCFRGGSHAEDSFESRTRQKTPEKRRRSRAA